MAIYKSVKLCDENGNCNGCNDCCGILTPISLEEMRILSRHLKKRHLKKIIKTLENGKISLICPFATEEGCEIYEIRPQICRTFHCDEKRAFFPKFDFRAEKVIANLLPRNYIELIYDMRKYLPEKEREVYEKELKRYFKF